MFWNKKKESEEPEIICKGCGIGITEGNAVLDANTGSFVCKDCKRVGYETDKITSIRDNEDDDRDNMQEQQKIKTEAAVKEEKISFHCKKCGYIISYSKDKGKPGSCSYCGNRF